MFFFSREHGDDEDDGIGVEEAALDPAEDAGPEMGEFGIEQASHDTADGDEKREEDCIFTEKRADAFAPAAVTERRREEHEKENSQDIREDGEKGKEVGDVLDDGCHGVLVGRAHPVFWDKASSESTPVEVDPSGKYHVG